MHIVYITHLLSLVNSLNLLCIEITKCRTNIENDLLFVNIFSTVCNRNCKFCDLLFSCCSAVCCCFSKVSCLFFNRFSIFCWFCSSACCLPPNWLAKAFCFVFNSFKISCCSLCTLYTQ